MYALGGVCLSVFQQDMSDSDEEEEKSDSSDSDEDDETSGSTDSDDEVRNQISLQTLTVLRVGLMIEVIKCFTSIILSQCVCYK